MPRYYCDYCDTYLTHDSPSVRKQHNSGYKHKANVRTYYQQFEEQQTQSLIDQRIKEHIGQTAVIQQAAAGAYFPQRARPPILPVPLMPNMGPQMPLVPGMRPPVFPRPVGVPGYGPSTMPSMLSPPGAPSMPMQVNALPRPPTLSSPTTTPGVAAPATTNGGPAMSLPSMYQANPAAPTSGGFDNYNINSSSGPQITPTSIASQDGFSYAQGSESNH